MQSEERGDSLVPCTKKSVKPLGEYFTVSVTPGRDEIYRLEKILAKDGLDRN